MFRIPLVHHHGDDEMSKHWQDKVEEESEGMKPKDPNISPGIYEVTFVHTTSQVSDLFENIHPPIQPGMWLPQL